MYANTDNDDKLIDAAVTLAEDERTVRAKNDISNVRRVTIDTTQSQIKPKQQFARGEEIWGM